MIFIESSTRKELRLLINESDYIVIYRVTGGYMCFDSLQEFQIWVNQK